MTGSLDGRVIAVTGGAGGIGQGIARAIVEAVTHWRDPEKLAEISTGLGEAMRGTESGALADGERLAQRGW